MKRIAFITVVLLISVPCFAGFGRETLYATRQETEFDAGDYSGVERVNANVQLEKASSSSIDQNNPNGATVVAYIGATCGAGNEFITGVDVTNINKIKIRLKRQGASLGNIFVTIYLNADKSAIGTSTLYPASYVSDGGMSEYDFSFSTPLTLLASTEYIWQLYYPAGIGGADQIDVYASNANPYAGGNYIQDNGGGSWVPLSAWDCYFITYYVVATNYTPEGTYTTDVMDLGSIPSTDKIFLTKQTTPGTSTIDWKYTGCNDLTSGTWSDSAVTRSGGSVGRYRYRKFYGHLVLGDTCDTPYFWFLEVDPVGAINIDPGDEAWEEVEFGR